MEQLSRVPVTVRVAAPADRLAIVGLLRDAHAAAEMPFPFSAAHALALADRHIADAGCLALVADDPIAGVLLATAQDHPFAAIRYAAETVWWIAPSARGRAATEMLATYEQWATERGCAFVGMAALATAPRAGIIYRRRGYREAETHFLKALAP